MRIYHILVILFVTTEVFGQNIYTAAGTGSAGFGGDGGSAKNAQLNNPKSVAIDPNGNLYFTDYNNHRVRKVDQMGVISTFAGTGTQGFSGDGANATAAELDSPFGIAVDQSGNVYISDISNNRIRKVNTLGIISTFAGTGIAGFNGDGIQANLAQLNNPFGIATDALGNVYIADNFNHRIRKVNTSGIISTIAGDGISGFNGDGGLAINAKLFNPIAVTCDINGNIYIADYSNNRIRKINTVGIITTIAGTNISGFGGDGGPALSAYISNPHDIAIDLAGNLYFADTGNNRIRKMNTQNTISTFAGGNGTFGGDSGPASNSGLLWPSGIVIDQSGNMYIGDAGNNRIREICFTDCLANINAHSKNTILISIAPNPNNGTFTVNTEMEGAKMVLYNSNGQIVFSSDLSLGMNTIFVDNLSVGLYSSLFFLENGDRFHAKISIE